MSILITGKSITKTFGVRPLFQDLNFVIESGERIGLIGPNGAGKSTLLSILAQNQSVDSGVLSLQKGLKTGFLTQTPVLDWENTVENVVLGPGNHDGDALAKGYEFISKLELAPYSNKKVGELSGGWRKRVALAKELVKDPELLLLDEPTNHLDVESIIWLENFLAKASFATVTVTHDRLFLQRVATRMIELDRRNPNGLLSVQGNYATYLKRKEELLETQKQQETVLKNKLRRETEWLLRGAKARTTKQQARIQAAGHLKDQVTELSARNQSKTAKIDFSTFEKKPKRLAEAIKVTKTLGDRVLFKDVDLFIGPESRIGLLGNNGCGKSTLIRILLGQEEPTSGRVFRSDNLKFVHFQQNRDSLDPTVTLRRAICPHGDQVNFRGQMIHINGYLDKFLFRKEQIDMAVGKLSGGEQSRVLIAQLMLKEANLLVLDEPTNDLDVETLDVLQDCLIDFDGAVLLVTHDRYFLDQVADQIVAFPIGADTNSGELISFAGLSQWENWSKSQSKAKSPKEKIETPPEPQKKKKMGFNETRELSQIEDKIHAAEAKLLQLQAEAEKPEIQSSASKLTELYQSISEAQIEVERLYERWTELEAMKSN